MIWGKKAKIVHVQPDFEEIRASVMAAMDQQREREIESLRAKVEGLRRELDIANGVLDVLRQTRIFS